MSAEVFDVPKCFAAIPPKVRRSPFFGSTARYLGAHSKARNENIGRLDFTTGLLNGFGFGEHFQGVQRLGNKLLLSGGINQGAKGSVLVVIEMGSRSAGAPPWALPSYAAHSYSYKSPFPQDASIDVLSVHKERWHAGGIQAADGVLAVPAYLPKDLTSDVHFFDFRGPAVVRLPSLAKPRMEAKAVALLRVGGQFLLAVWDDERLDFQVCPAASFPAGFGQPKSLFKEQLPAGFRPHGFPLPAGTYQSVNLVRDLGDGLLYLVGTRNARQYSPYAPGGDYADLYRLDWRAPYEAYPTLELVRSKQMYCYNQQCNFGAAAGIYADGQHRLWIYSAAHWLHDGNRRFNFNEYSYA